MAHAGAVMESLLIDDSPETQIAGLTGVEFRRVDGGPTPQRHMPTSDSTLANKQTLQLSLGPKLPAAPPPSALLSPESARSGEGLAEAKLRLIQRVSEKLVRIFEPQQLLDEIMSIVIDQTGADRGILCLLDEKRVPVPLVTRGLAQGEQIRLSRTVLRRLLDERAGVLIHAGDTPSTMMNSLIEMQVHSTLCVPLWTGDRIIGLLSLDSTRTNRTFTEEDLDMLLAVAHQAAVGIERGRLSQLVESERQMRGYLSKYLDNRIVEEIAKRGSAGDPLAPAERVITVLFSDIVSFTKMSEGMEPGPLANFVREYLTAMTEIIFAHGGTIDKYIGDAVMALFGAPVASLDSPVNAIRAALAMRDRLKEFKPPSGLHGALRARFGINTGRATVGNIGSAQRMEYTAIGDTVNVASRLQTFARPNEICIDENTHAQTAGAFIVEEIGTIDVKNRAAHRGLQGAAREIDNRLGRSQSATSNRCQSQQSEHQQCDARRFGNCGH